MPLTQVNPFRSVSAVGKVAPYWENDTTMNPILVRFVSRNGDFFDVRLPDGSIKQVHCHTLGVFH